MWRNRLTGLVCAVVYLSHAAPAFAVPERTLEIWLRAFIADTHPGKPGYVKKTTSGKSVIESPTFTGLEPYAGTCFTTDQRGYSTTEDASSRAAAYVKLRVKGRIFELIDSKRSIGPTHNVDCSSGADLRPAQSASENSITIGSVKVNQTLRVLNLRISSGNPFFDPVSVKIDMETVLTYNILSRKLSVVTVYGYFPSFEVLYRIDGGPINVALQQGPHGDSTVLSLIDLGTGINTRNANYEINLGR